MKVEIGERKTLEFLKHEYKGPGSLLPVSIYEKGGVVIELLEINISLAKAMIPFVQANGKENSFISITRTSQKKYIILPGAAIIEKIGKSVSA